MPTKDTPQETLELGQEVFDSDGNKIGKVQARFERYVLVEGSGLFGRAYYVPRSIIGKSGSGNSELFVKLSKAEMREAGLQNVPEDLYDDPPELGVPQVFSGVPKFAKRPLSPAQTGHYNYGRRWPGINTDAAGSYHRDEVVPIPQKLVEASEDNRRKA